MNKDEFITVDKIKWWVQTNNGIRIIIQPLCPTHGLRLHDVKNVYSKYGNIDNSNKLKCEDCESLYLLPRSYQEEKVYVTDRLDANFFKKMKYINLDDEALPIAEDKIPKDSEYFVTSLLTQSKVGKRLVVYAGKRGGNQKTQIFVEPEIKRLSFDQKDLHPADVFASVEAIFNDGTKSKIEKINKGGEK